MSVQCEIARLREQCIVLERQYAELKKQKEEIKSEIRELCELLAPLYKLSVEEFARLMEWATDRGMTAKEFNLYLSSMDNAHEVQGSNTEYCDRASEASEGLSSHVES